MGCVASFLVYGYVVLDLMACKENPVPFLSMEADAVPENLSEQQHLAPIRDRNEIYSATGDGKIPWISANDIAAVAFRALTDEVSHDTAHLVLGPELLSYSDVGFPCIAPALNIRYPHLDIISNQY